MGLSDWETIAVIVSAAAAVVYGAIKLIRKTESSQTELAPTRQADHSISAQHFGPSYNSPTVNVIMGGSTTPPQGPESSVRPPRSKGEENLYVALVRMYVYLQKDNVDEAIAIAEEMLGSYGQE